MSDSLRRVFVHLVWTTWDRAPLLDDDIRAEVFARIARQARRLATSGVVFVAAGVQLRVKLIHVAYIDAEVGEAVERHQAGRPRSEASQVQ